jgi:hypothetical protein
MRQPLKIAEIYCALALALTLHCSRTVAVNSGGSTTTDNAKVMGKVVYAGGAPAKNASVRVRPGAYVRPVAGAEPDSITRHDTATDDSGRYAIDSLNIGTFRIEVNDNTTSAALLTCNITTAKDSIVLPVDTMRAYTPVTGKIDSVTLARAPLYVQVFGVDRIVKVDSVTGVYTIPNLPPGEYRLRLVSIDTTFTPKIIDTVKTDTITPVIGSWAPTNGPYAGGTITCFAVGKAGGAAGLVFAGTGKNGVFVSADNGSSWQEASTGLDSVNVYGKVIQCLGFSPDGNTIFAGTAGGVFKSVNNGGHWYMINTGLSSLGRGSFQSIAAIQTATGGTNIIAGTKYEGVYLSSFGGAIWSTSNTGLADTMNVVSVAAAGNLVFAGTPSNGVFVSADYGATWTSAAAGITYSEVISMAAVPGVVAVGNSSGVFVSFDNGASWKPHTIPGYFTSVNAIALAAPAAGSLTVLAVQYGQGVFVSADSGATWSTSSIGLTNNFVNTIAASGAYALAGTDGDGVFRSADNGSTWSASNVGLTNVIVSTLAATGAGLFAGMSSGICRSTDNGVTWIDASTGITQIPVTAIAASPGGNLFAASGNGVYKTIDNGATWTSINSAAWTIIDVTSLACVGGRLFVGAGNGGSTVDHGVFVSADNGASWTAASAGMDLSTVDVRVFAVMTNAPGDTALFAGTYGDGVFLSNNGGAAWTQINNGLTNKDVLALAVSGSTLFAGTFVGGVFYSNDKGASWASVKTGISATATVQGFTVYGGAVFAGTAYGVYVTINSGVSWTPVNGGLINTNVNTFIIFNNYLYSGTNGSGVWKVQLK